MNDLSFYLELVKSKLSKRLYEHTLGVVSEAKIISEANGIDPIKAMIASALHDSMKYLSIEEQEKIVIDRFGLDTALSMPKGSYHSFVGYIYAKEELLIDDIDILNAILNHTIGRANMSDVEKIVFISDFSDPSRKLEESKIAHNLALKDLDEATLYVMNHSISYYENRGEFVPKKSYESLNYYKGIVNGRKTKENS